MPPSFLRFPLHNVMTMLLSITKSSAGLTRTQWTKAIINSLCRASKRGLTAVTNARNAGDAATLPLAGIRILDMTRVLAGVSPSLLL